MTRALTREVGLAPYEIDISKHDRFVIRRQKGCQTPIAPGHIKMTREQKSIRRRQYKDGVMCAMLDYFARRAKPERKRRKKKAAFRESILRACR